MSAITHIPRISLLLYLLCGWGWGAFIRWWPPSTMWVGPLNLFMATTGDVWIILSYWIWGYVLHVEHITCVIMNCGWLSYPSLFLNNSLASTGGKQYQKITIPIFTLALQNFAFSMLLSFYTLYHACYFSSISPVWVVIAVSKWLYVSPGN